MCFAERPKILSYVYVCIILNVTKYIKIIWILSSCFLMEVIEVKLLFLFRVREE